MEQKNIEMIGGGLVCDNENCDFEDMSIKQSDYKDWVNKPCPKCGENLLTEEDFINSEKMQLAVNFMNSLSQDEINEFADCIDIEALKETPFLKDAGGLELLSSEGKVSMTVKTHKEIKAVELKLLSDGSGSKHSI